MSWTALRTWVTGEVPTSTIMNAQLRDNINALVWQEASVATSQTTTSATYTDLATVGPALTLTTLAAAYVIVVCSASTSASGNSAYMSYAITGASTIAAVDSTCVEAGKDGAAAALESGRISQITGLTPGSNTFTAKYRVDASTGTFLRRSILVLGVA